MCFFFLFLSYARLFRDAFACIYGKSIFLICLWLSFFRHAVAQWSFWYDINRRINEMNQCQNCDGISASITQTHNLFIYEIIHRDRKCRIHLSKQQTAIFYFSPHKPRAQHFVQHKYGDDDKINDDFFYRNNATVLICIWACVCNGIFFSHVTKQLW